MFKTPHRHSVDLLTFDDIALRLGVPVTAIRVVIEVPDLPASRKLAAEARCIRCDVVSFEESENQTSMTSPTE